MLLLVNTTRTPTFKPQP